MWTDRCPADVLPSGASLGVNSAMVDDTDRPVNIFAHQSCARQLQKGYPQCSVVMLGLAKGNSGRNSRVQLGRTVLDSARPGSDSRVAATVRVQKGERIRGARVTGNRDQHPSTRGQCIENAAVMGLKPDPAHGARETKFRQI